MAESRELNLILKLKDQVSNDLKGISGQLDKMQPAFKAMAAVGTTAFVGVSAAIYKSTQSAVSAQEIFNKFDVVFGDVGKEAEAVAQDLRNNFGLAESSAKDLLSSTGDMLTGFGMSGDAALDLAEKTNKLAVDLASFTNIEGGAERASRSLTKALLGESDSAKELGVVIIDKDVKAKIEAMKAAGEFTNETERQQKALATLAIALEQSKNAVGDFARTQDSVANQQRVLKERTKELSETLGVTFIPLMADVLEAIAPVIKNLTEWINKNPELAKNILIVTGAVSGLVAIMGILGIMLPGIIATGTAMGVMFTTLISPVGLIVAAISILIAIGVLLWKNWDVVQKKTKEIWESIAEFFSSIGESIKKNIEEVWGSITDYFGSVWDDIKSGAKDAINFLIGMAESMANAYIKAANFIISALNKIQVSVPEWVPRIGGKSFGVNISKVSEISIPRLAEGGLITKPTTLLAGEAGPEAIIPLNRMAGAGIGGITINVYGDVTGEDLIERVGEELMKMLKRETKL